MFYPYLWLAEFEMQRIARMTPAQREAHYAAQKAARLKDKDSRMKRRLERRRDQLWRRNWMIVGQVVFWLCAPFLGVAAVATVWRFCAWVVFT